jgi:hypothetical protein
MQVEFLPICPNEGNAGVAGTWLAAQHPKHEKAAERGSRATLSFFGL